MAGKAVPIGPTGIAVARNIRAAREKTDVTQEVLSEKLEAIGRPMSVPSIRAMENGRRRIDVDDLTALAVVLKVSPADLLSIEGESTPLVTGVENPLWTASDLNRWIRGEARLDPFSMADYWTREANSARSDLKATEASLAIFKESNEDMTLYIAAAEKEIARCKERIRIADDNLLRLTAIRTDG